MKEGEAGQEGGSNESQWEEGGRDSQIEDEGSYSFSSPIYSSLWRIATRGCTYYHPKHAQLLIILIQNTKQTIYIRHSKGIVKNTPQRYFIRYPPLEHPFLFPGLGIHSANNKKWELLSRWWVVSRRMSFDDWRRGEKSGFMCLVAVSWLETLLTLHRRYTFLCCFFFLLSFISLIPSFFITTILLIIVFSQTFFLLRMMIYANIVK